MVVAMVVVGVNVVIAYGCGLARVLPEYLLVMLALYLLGGFVWGLRNREALKPRRLDPYPDS